MSIRLIEWTEKFSVGFEDIDKQHKKLIELINKMFEKFLSKQADEIVKEVLDELIEYTQYHFDLEEKYFYLYKYPKAEEHTKIHQSFIAKVLEVKKDLIENKDDVKYEIYNFLKEWLSDHILGADMEYSKFFKSNKLKENIKENEHNKIKNKENTRMRINKTIQSVETVTELIESGRILSLAGDEKILSQLPKGKWIAGTTPYFMTKDKGGVFTQDKIYVDDLTDFVEEFKIESYSKENFEEISNNLYENGFTIFIIPAFSEIHEYFAVNNWKIKNLYKNPFVGWISGFDLNSEGSQAKTCNGLLKESTHDKAIALHVKLPSNKKAGVSIVNIFKEGKTNDKLEFLEAGFSAKECLINNEKVNFAEYIISKKIDTKLPIVADYSGNKINVSIKEVDQKNKVVHFYAPVFQNRTYKFAEPIEDYVSEFKVKVSKTYNEMAFSCNCILNYLYGELENNKVSIGGPITFGEIAFLLLNQTLVYMTINNVKE